nr:MAG TPA_asm: hypothetical protein [Caudoviricetes sp.]
MVTIPILRRGNIAGTMATEAGRAEWSVPSGLPKPNTQRRMFP